MRPVISILCLMILDTLQPKIYHIIIIRGAKELLKIRKKIKLEIHVMLTLT